MSARRIKAARADGSLDPRLVLMHQVMLSDRPRMSAFETAIKRAVSPGHVVVDIGAGTLALSLMALRCGARCVYAIEVDSQMAALARAIVADNNIFDRLVVVENDARSVDLPEKADVLVSEMMGNLGPEEEMAEILAAAASKHLRPGGAIIPRRLTTLIQAIGFDGEGWGVWSETVSGFSLSAVQDYVAPAAQLHFFARPPFLLSEAVTVIDAVLGSACTGQLAPCELPIIAPGGLDALVIHFTAHLTDTVTLSNFPSYPGCNWAVFVWPLRHTIVRPGDVLHARIIPGANVREVTSWRVDCGITRARCLPVRADAHGTGEH